MNLSNLARNAIASSHVPSTNRKCVWLGSRSTWPPTVHPGRWFCTSAGIGLRAESESDAALSLCCAAVAVSSVRYIAPSGNCSRVSLSRSSCHGAIPMQGDVHGWPNSPSSSREPYKLAPPPIKAPMHFASPEVKTQALAFCVASAMP
eukprot:2703422-Prymnesium_polylepis.1